jgi:hypothetical protein
MSEILSHHKVDEYYREGLKYPAFINTLNEYQQRKVLEVCNAGISKATDYLNKTIELNIGNPNLERNLEVVREVMMGKQLRLREALLLALGTMKKVEPEPKPKSIKKGSKELKVVFDNYLTNFNSELKKKEVLDLMPTETAQVASFITAMKEAGFLSSDFFELNKTLQHRLLKNRFNLDFSYAGYVQQMNMINHEDITRMSDIKLYLKVLAKIN